MTVAGLLQPFSYKLSDLNPDVEESIGYPSMEVTVEPHSPWRNQVYVPHSAEL